MSRRHARETAMQYLYGMDMSDQEWEQIEPDIDQRKDLGPKDAEYVKRVVQGFILNRAKIDSLLSDNLKNWNIGRIPRVDLAILRLGTYELLWCGDIPPGATINECVGMAKNFSTDKSGAFVNGILAGLHRSLEGDPRPDPE